MLTFWLWLGFAFLVGSISSAFAGYFAAKGLALAIMQEAVEEGVGETVMDDRAGELVFNWIKAKGERVRSKVLNHDIPSTGLC